jgi:hypothetical protein
VQALSIRREEPLKYTLQHRYSDAHPPDALLSAENGATTLPTSKYTPTLTRTKTGARRIPGNRGPQAVGEFFAKMDGGCKVRPALDSQRESSGLAQPAVEAVQPTNRSFSQEIPYNTSCLGTIKETRANKLHLVRTSIRPQLQLFHHLI